MIFMDSSIVFYNNDHVRAKHSVVHYNIVFSLKSTTQLYKPFKKKNQFGKRPNYGFVNNFMVQPGLVRWSNQ